MLRAALLLAAAALCACASRPGHGDAQAAMPPEWFEPVEPMHIVGPLWSVGTRELAVYLIVTPGGDILLSGAMADSADDIEDAIRKAGFDPQDIRILLTTHAHVDHAGTLAHFKQLTGALVETMAGDAPLLESGGASDYLFAHEDAFHFEPVHVDRVLQDGDKVALGGVTLTARLTPGHTPGNTTWILDVPDGGRSWRVVIAGSLTLNPGTHLVRDPSYPGILQDYRRAVALLESLQPDIFLAPHASQCGLELKRARAATDGPAAFVDPDGYRAFVAAGKAAIEQQVADEEARAAKP
jgi:metallo-beta-lactamase class B